MLKANAALMHKAIKVAWLTLAWGGGAAAITMGLRLVPVLTGFLPALSNLALPA